jgi:adenosine deaminase
VLKVDRIDHGNHVLDDMVLTARLAKAHIGLTVCPLSNLKLGVVKTLKRHPLKRMLNLGLRVSVNSDDPAYFGGYIGDNYIAAAEALALSQSEIVQIVRNSFLGTFLSGAEKSRHLEALDAFAHA